MDRYDPEKNPIMHLIDDAPLLLMIRETMETIFVTGRDALQRDPLQRLADQRMSWRLRICLGAVLLAIGAILLLLVIGKTVLFFAVILPSLVLILGLLTIRGHPREHEACNKRRVVLQKALFSPSGPPLSHPAPVSFLSSAPSRLRAVRERRRLTKGLGSPRPPCSLASSPYHPAPGTGRDPSYPACGLTLMAGAFTLLDALRNAARLMEAAGASNDHPLT